MLIITFAAIETAADMPVGGVQDIHEIATEIKVIGFVVSRQVEFKTYERVK